MVCFFFLVDVIGLHRISPSICSIMSLLMDECTRSRSAADTKWSREVAPSESRSGFQRDWGRLEKRGGGNLLVFSRGKRKPCPGVAGWKAAVQKNPWELWVDKMMTRSHQRSAGSLAALAEVQPACGRNWTVSSAQHWGHLSGLWVQLGASQEEAGVVEGCGCAQPGAEEEKGRPYCCPQLPDGGEQRGQSLALLVTEWAGTRARETLRGHKETCFNWERGPNTGIGFWRGGRNS